MYSAIVDEVSATQNNTILLVKSGSRSYGLEHADSDWDAQGIYIGDRARYLGYRSRSSQFSGKNVDMNYEYTVHEIQKFFELASACNPNVIEMLFTDPDDILTAQWAGLRVRDARNAFLCSRARYSFTGYAMSQLKRIKTHRGWLLTPPKKKPERADFGLPNDTTLNHDTLVAMEATMSENATLIPPAVVQVWQAERRYQNAKREFEQYEGWKKNRNKKRAELERKFGYDTHHGKHLARLLTAGQELLATGVLPVRAVGDRRKLILSVANGELSYDSFLSIAQDMHDGTMEMKSVLPDRPDHQSLDDLCQEIILWSMDHVKK